MIFNDRRQARANARALKKANGPSLASATNYNVSQSNRWERHDVRMEADYGQSSASGSRGARMSKAAKVIEKKQKEGK